MQAITTKFHGPTDSRGSRVTARCQARRMTVGWDHALDVEKNHARAAEQLARKLGWNGRWIGGALPDGTGNVFVCVERSHEGSFTIEGA